jgi:hypothetical protein
MKDAQAEELIALMREIRTEMRIIRLYLECSPFVGKPVGRSAPYVFTQPPDGSHGD